MGTYIDPVAQPNDYQRMLLSLVGDRDPAEIQAGTPAELRRLIDDAGDLLQERPAPAEWSVLECIAHIADAELVVGGRYRWILAEEAPEIMPYDQDLWVDHLHSRDDDPAALLAEWEPLRIANLALWQRSTADQRARYGIHRERGRETYELTFTMLAGHDIFHIDQARRTLDLVRGR
jgi:hypothetical protein